MEQNNLTIITNICANRGGDYTVTEYSNAEGSIGGYVLTPSPQIDDGAPSLYDEDGTLIATGTMFASQEQRDAFNEKIATLKRDFPIEKEVVCS